MADKTKKRRCLYIYHFNPERNYVIETIERQKFKDPMTEHEYNKAVRKILKDKINVCWSSSEPRI